MELIDWKEILSSYNGILQKSGETSVTIDYCKLKVANEGRFLPFVQTLGPILHGNESYVGYLYLHKSSAKCFHSIMVSDNTLRTMHLILKVTSICGVPLTSKEAEESQQLMG